MRVIHIGFWLFSEFFLGVYTLSEFAVMALSIPPSSDPAITANKDSHRMPQSTSTWCESKVSGFQTSDEVSKALDVLRSSLEEEQ